MPIKIKMVDNQPVKVKISDNSSETGVGVGDAAAVHLFKEALKRETTDRIAGDKYLQEEIDALTVGKAAYLLITENENGSIDISLLNEKEEILDTKTITLTEKLIKNVELDYETGNLIFTHFDNTTFTCSIEAIKNAILSEAIRAINAEEALDNKISQEIQDRIVDVDAEEARARVAEQALDTKITNEILRASSTEDVLDDKIESEISRAEDAEEVLQANINREASIRSAADDTLQTNIDEEARIRGEADDTLQHNIDVEAATRANADTALNNRINALDLSQVGQDGKYIKFVSQLDGQVSAETADFDTSIPATEDNPSNITAPTTQAVRDAIDALSINDITNTIGKTVTKISEQSGIISAEFTDIQIAENQVTDLVSDLSTIDTRLDTIESKIPPQATAQNQLADKAFVNSSIATNTANFLGTYNIVTDLGLTVDATEQEIAAAIAAQMASELVIPTNNDYVFIAFPDITEPDQYTKFDRYKYNGAWEYEYTLNNSSFTASQWAAINSGATATLINKIDPSLFSVNYDSTNKKLTKTTNAGTTTDIVNLGINDGSDAESITVGSKTLNVVTKDTAQTITGNKTFGTSNTATTVKFENGTLVLGNIAGSIANTKSKISFQNSNGTERHAITANTSGVIFDAAGNRLGFYDYAFTPTNTNSADLGRDATNGRDGRWNNIHLAGSFKKYDGTTGYTLTLQNKTGTVALKSDIDDTINTLNKAEEGQDGYYIKKVKEDAGIITATKQQFDQSVSSSSTHNNVPSSKAVWDIIDSLDVSSVGSDGGYIKAISETDGKISATYQAFDLVIDDSSDSDDEINAPTSKAVKNYITREINKLDAALVGSDGSYLKTIVEENGKIAATLESFDTIIPAPNSQTQPSQITAPTSKAVVDYVDTYGGKIDSVSLDGTPLTIDQNKNVDIPVIIDDSEDNEFLTVNSTTLNLVTRDTAQTITANKTFTSDTITFSGRKLLVSAKVDSDLLPLYNDDRSLGSTNNRWKNLYLSEKILYKAGNIGYEIYATDTNQLHISRDGVDKLILDNNLFYGTNNNISLGNQLAKFKNLYLVGHLGNNNANYGLILPDMTSWDANKTIAVKEDLNLSEVGADGSYIKFVSQADGQLSASAEPFDISIPTTTAGASNINAPTTKAVRQAINYTNPDGTTVAVGGIGKGTTFNDKSVVDILEKMLYPYVAFNFTSFTTNPSATTYEYGASKTITAVTPTFELGSRPLTSVKVGFTSGGDDYYIGSTAASGTAITLTNQPTLDGLTSSVKIYMTISDYNAAKEDNTTMTKSVEFKFVKYYYLAVTDDTTIPTTASATGVVSLGTKTDRDNVETQDHNYIWFLAPAEKVSGKTITIQQFAMNQWNDMTTIDAGQVTFITQTNQSLTYHAYRTSEMMAAIGKYQLKIE